MPKKDSRKISNWALAFIYLVIVLFIIDIYFVHKFFPYVYEYVRNTDQVFVKNGVGEVVWGPYENQFNQTSHEDELRVVFHTSLIDSSLLTLFTFLLVLPIEIKLYLETSIIWHKITIYLASALVIYNGYQYLDNLLELLPYLKN